MSFADRPSAGVTAPFGIDRRGNTARMGGRRPALRFYWRRRAGEMPSAEWAALLLRLMIAFFFWAHLYNKFFTKQGFWGWWGALTHSFPPVVPIYVLTVEFGCAVLMPLGLRTRWVALYAVPSFLGIIAFWLRIGGYWFTNPGAEFPIMWLCLLVLKIVMGDGAYALQLGRVARGDRV